MCGRAYETYTAEELEARYLNKRPIRLPELKPNYNVCPTHLSPVLRMAGGEREIDGLRWGLVPPWAKDGKTKFAMINARGEEIESKPSFKGPFLKRRCVIPLSGFFEWKREEKSKRPFAIQLKDRSIMSLAGIWESCTTAAGEVLETFAALTIASNSVMAPIHDRMPVILDDEGIAAWLDPSHDGKAERLKVLIRACPDDWLTTYEISTLVNSPKNNRPEVLDPVG